MILLAKKQGALALFFSIIRLAAAVVPAAFASPGSPAAAQTEPLITAIHIEIPDMPGDVAKMADFARDLILLREGERFSEARFHDSVELLKDCKMFRKINIPDPESGEHEFSLTFQLTPFRRIKDIHINGGFPLFEKEILRAVDLSAGSVFDPERIPGQQETIRDLYKKEGYLNPEVEISVAEDKSDGTFELYINIKKGDFFQVKSVEIEGNRAFSDWRLKMRLKTWQASLLFGDAGQFVRKKLDNDLKGLTAFYRRKGFANVEITSEVNKDPQSLAADIRIMVREGPAYHIEFVGNKHFWNHTLKKDLVLFEKGDMEGLGLRKSIRNIKERYHGAGYLTARVTAEEEAKKAEGPAAVARHVRIAIDEGPRSVVEKLVIAGNKALSEEIIRKQLLTRPPGFPSAGAFIPKVLEEDKKAVKTLYLKHGYMQPLVEEVLEWRENEKTGDRLVAIVINVKEGPQTLVSSVSCTGLNVLPESAALAALALKEGGPFREYMIKSDENRLAEMISEKGFPYVTVTGTFNIADDAGPARIIYKVQEGPFVKMGEIYFSGNFRTRDEILRNELSVETGEPFSLKKAIESNKKIRDVNALDSVDLALLGIKERADEIAMLVTVEEKKPYFFELGLGYDSARELFLHSRLGDRNLFGRNLDSWISGEFSGIGYRGEAGVTEPRLLGSPISAALNLYTEETEELNQDFGSKKYGGSILLSRKFSRLRQMSSQLGFRYEHREQYRDDNSPIPPEEEEQYRPRSFFVISPSLTYNSTDSFVKPENGLYFSLALDVSKGLERSLDNFLKYRADMRYYYTPLERTTLAVRGRYGKILPYGLSDEIPEDQLFFLGGTADVRGFAENKLRFDQFGDPVGGRTEIVGSLEVRFDMGNNLEIIAFYDTGAVKDSRLDTGADDFRSSVGLGLGYITPIGPISIVYGHKLDRMARESAGRLHFNIGYSF